MIARTLNREHSIDWVLASSCVTCPSGHVVVEMVPWAKMRGELYLPDGFAEVYRADVGVVIATDPCAFKVKGRVLEYPQLGAEVIVHAEDGHWLRGFDLGGYRTENEVRVYGTFAKFQGEPGYCDYWESIMAEIVGGKIWRMYGDKILMRMDPRPEKQGNIFLAETAQRRSLLATVEAVGPLEFDVRPGQRVYYDERALQDTGVILDDPDLAICNAAAIHCMANTPSDNG